MHISPVLTLINNWLYLRFLLLTRRTRTANYLPAPIILRSLLDTKLNRDCFRESILNNAQITWMTQYESSTGKSTSRYSEIAPWTKYVLIFRYGEKQRRNSTSQPELTGVQLLAATFTQLRKPYQQLLIPITIWIGMEQAFIGADFTQAYVSCAMGVSHVGFVMISFGVVNAICSLLFGSVMKYIGRAPIIIFGAIVHTVLQIWLLLWKPHPDSPIAFFIASGLWGVGDSVWQTQVNG